MTLKRFAMSSLHNGPFTCSTKRFSFLRALIVLITVFFTWGVIIILQASDTVRKFRQSLTPDFLSVPADQLNHEDLILQQWAEMQEEQPNDFIAAEHTLRAFTDNTLSVDHVISSNPALGETVTEDPLISTESPDVYTMTPPQPFPSSSQSNSQPLKMVLMFVEDTNSHRVLSLGQFFSQQRMEYRVHLASDELPSLLMDDINVPKYSLLVFEEYVSYLAMNSTKRSILNDYCKRFNVGILGTTLSTRTGELEFFATQKLKIQHRMKLRQYRLEPTSLIWRVAKIGPVFQDMLPSEEWSIFIPNHVTYRPLAFSTVSPDWSGTKSDVNTGEFGCIVALHDMGLMDNIQKILIGYDVNFWLNSIVAMDAITFLSQGRLGLPLDRYLQVDVDDMFVGRSGIRTQVKDAEAMVASQAKIRQYVPGFKYILGFSGGMYLEGDENEDSGERRILELAKEFIWFDHMYRHEQPHQLHVTHLRQSMDLNANFAKANGIPMMKEYIVTPHHSGVYPAVETLYNEFFLRGVVATSTEVYPRNHPYWGRRGFIYRGVMVLPRQTCGLFTNIVKFEHYHGGKSELDASIFGGYLFKVFLQTPVMVFMTHMSNYASDQLAQYSFENVVQFVVKWTNLRLTWLPPVDLARQYFTLYPQEAMPIWTNPCDYHKHMETWPEGNSCNRLPSFIIVGPQKTGTTALLTFLQAHPSIQGSKLDPDYFEEVQFFNKKNYMLGLDWYQNHFDEPAPGKILFEKSANYFENEYTPKRVFALLPKVKIIVVLAEPGRRAYSWYQHLRSHNDPVAMNQTFYNIISVSEMGPKQLKDARNRCLLPGLYAIHLRRWLQYFATAQIFLIDADKLTRDPIAVMNELQQFIGVQPFIDYSTKLKFDAFKGFFCLSTSGCLSSSKGRKYPSMDSRSSLFLKQYYREFNKDLRDLLDEMGRPYPEWLAEDAKS